VPSRHGDILRVPHEEEFMSRGMHPRALALAILGALAVGVAASSASGVQRATVEVQKGNTSCSALIGSGSLGVARFAFREGSSLELEVRIKHGLPKTPYTVILLDADTCTEIVTFSSPLTTKRNGRAKKELRADVGASRAFVVDVYDGNGGIHNMSEAAHFS
jgi:hypothetical protein